MKHYQNLSQDPADNIQEIFQSIGQYKADKGKPYTIVYIAKQNTPFGDMLAGASDQGICLLEYPDKSRIIKQIKQIHKNLNAEF